MYYFDCRIQIQHLFRVIMMERGNYSPKCIHNVNIDASLGVMATAIHTIVSVNTTGKYIATRALTKQIHTELPECRLSFFLPRSITNSCRKKSSFSFNVEMRSFSHPYLAEYR